ncbi:MAG: hypothetical protein A3C30_00805 [Candidatus Levybacteria bacterium RIFCSPHIGHO2_02_FULL_40_18]|nr:MAG: hypothetical protein A2869_03125 [Candidatus Levybacteria bacterium RIFCSPHIGHO2_01_FULL_40_58]OGH27239.1 MAG: hypothetical protein A3C30_00805 [Candidatus Levybacteria bacterium RIFCSPHIGHO2_02_FULL_40_18]OGH31098.1 MAG: hypothetical protein A3E43_05220 [Candidatus Levybacteria bacterium RIFCSPHIGHO2_12_FULL_40_31]OGH40734.1 MAG: hypothetical protein A2894_03220 [Candidatus Levybacteria bacterium RIFCSPLOWO2_01_FULL_40_64]OGH49373.1 MAG: hypothetical protein A3I54_01860 [Candidatus Lev
MIEQLKKNWHLVLYFFLAIFSISPLLSPGFFPMHDDTQVARVFEMGKSLSHGMFPVRWVEDLGYGYGYPIFNFYSVLPYYIGGIITSLGVTALDSTKIIFTIALIGSGVSMFFLAKEFFGKLAGLVSAVIYLYFPYHAINVYVRGDLAELSAYAFLPFAFLSLFKIHKSGAFLKKYVVLGSLSIAAVILSHNLSAFMLFIFIGIFILASLAFNKGRKILLLPYALILIFAFLFSAFYTLPAIFEMKYTNIASIIGGSSYFGDHFVCINQLWDSPWGFGGSAPTCVDGMSFKLGKLNVLLFGISLLLFIINFKKLKDKLLTVSFIFAGLVFSIFMTLSYSSILWGLPFMDFLQFPWRFLSFSGLFLALILGYLVWQVKSSTNLVLDKNLLGDRIFYITAFIIILLTLFYNVRLFEPKTIHDRQSSYYTNEAYLKWTVSRISDEYLPRNFTTPSSQASLRETPFDIIKGSGNLVILLNKTSENRAKVNLSEEGTVRANIAYFPAWKVYINGRESSYIIKDNGFYINLPKGEHTLTTKFVQTPVEKISNLLSLIGLLGIIIVIIPYGKKTRLSS